MVDRLQKLRECLLPERIKTVGHDAIERELFLIKGDLIDKLAIAYDSNIRTKNVGNSALVYCLGLSDNYDKDKELKTKGGSPPDVDSDFMSRRRDEVKEYVRSKYGKDYVASIGTTGRFFPKSAVRDMAFVLGHDQVFINKIAKLIPENHRGRVPSLEECENASPELLENTEYLEVWNKAKKIIGLPRNKGQHAAGVVIATDEPLYRVMPLYRKASSEIMITEFDMHEVEELGYFKFDFLSIKNLDVISKTLEYIKMRHGIDIKMDDIDYDDLKVYELIRSGKLSGVFQLEGSLRALAMRAKPTCLDDVSAVNATGRPGPIDSGLTDLYIKNKNLGIIDTGFQGKLDAKLRVLLSDSYGVMIYQEQVMKITVEVAGFTLAEADVTRKAIGKKKIDVMNQLKEKFVQGAVKNGYQQEQVEELWEHITGFADYAFNKAHSLAYSIISYQEAWLKTHYSSEFMAALMSLEDDTEKISGYVGECKSLGVGVKGPSIQKATRQFSFSPNGDIVFGLESIKGLGKTAVSSILKVRPKTGFSSFEHMLDLIDRRKVNSKAIECLVKAGAFDDMGYDRQTLLDSVKLIVAHYKASDVFRERKTKCRERKREYDVAQAEIQKIEAKLDLIPMRVKDKKTKDPDDQEKFNSLRKEKMILRKVRLLKEPEKPEMESIPKGTQIRFTLDLLKAESDVLGCYVTMHPTDFITASNQTSFINEFYPDSKGYANGVITKIKEYKARSGLMAWITVEDATAAAELTVFPSTYSKSVHPKVGDIIRFQYRVENAAATPVKAIVDRIRLVKVE